MTRRTGPDGVSEVPVGLAAADAWVRARRGPKNSPDPNTAVGAAWEEEADGRGGLLPTAVVFLANRECPFTCLMCDLWVDTLDEPVRPGQIPLQIRGALARLPAARQIKLYNAGSFFDPLAIPPDDDEEIAGLVAPFDQVVVESHPAFLSGRHGQRCLRFRDRLARHAEAAGRTPPHLQVAIGLETAHPGVLARLNKRMTLRSFGEAAGFLARNGIAMRVFILLRPPFLNEEQGLEWACRSLDLAAQHGAAVSVVIPTRGGNGALEALGADFAQPRLSSLERAVEYGLARGRGVVLADEWNLERFFSCTCAPARVTRLRAMNRTQRVPPPVVCPFCDRPEQP
jgi:radical SAM enzyme (TIGR01210 family)